VPLNLMCSLPQPTPSSCHSSLITHRSLASYLHSPTPSTISTRRYPYFAVVSRHGKPLFEEWFDSRYAPEAIDQAEPKEDLR
jgi:hypothetical protein